MMPWSAEAKAILESGTVEGKKTAWIYVEYLGAFSDAYRYDVTTRVLDWGDLERGTSAIDQNFNTVQLILRLQNFDSYLTPNFMAGGRTQIANVWSFRPVGEAHFRDCRVYIDFSVRLSDRSWETIRMMRGSIADLNLTDDGGPICELILKDITFDALDKTLTLADGPNVEFTL